MNSRETRLILIGAAVLLSLGMGIRQSFGLFLTPVTRDLAVTAADFTLAVAVQNIVWGLSQAPIGAIADRFGLRATMMAGAAIYVVGLGVMAASGGTTGLLVSGGLIGVALSCTASSLGLTAAARAAPEARRSKILGAVAAAGSLGTFLIPLATQALLAHQAWQIAALFFLILAIAMLPAGFCAGGADRLPRGTGPRTTMRAVLGEAARHRPFLVMSGAYFVCGLNLVFLATHLPTHLAICGQDPMLSAEALAVIGGTNCIGSLLAGWLGGSYPKHILLGLLYILPGAPLHPARFCLHPLFHDAADPGEHARLRRGDGDAVAQRGATRQRAGRGDVRHALHGDVARPRLRDAPGRLLPRRLGRRADLRCARFLRPRLADRCLGRFRRRHHPDPRGRAASPA